MDASSYTYLRIKQGEEETWAAITKTPVKKGERIRLVTSVVMHGFHSASLGRTFPRIVFASPAP